MSNVQDSSVIVCLRFPGTVQNGTGCSFHMWEFLIMIANLLLALDDCSVDFPTF